MRKLTGVVLLAFITFESARAEGLTEPPLLVYGKVWDFNEGASRQLFSGSLTLTFESVSDPADRHTFTTELGRFSGGDQWSYFVEIPQRYLPHPGSQKAALMVGPSSSDYLIRSIDLKGNAASPLNSTQSLLTTSFGNKAAEHRLDLQLSLPVVDQDGDGLPDWWEELHGLNPLSAFDASSNTDGDDWDAEAEFRNGGDPNVDNRSIQVSPETIPLPRNGQAGLWFSILDSDDAASPENIEFSVATIGTPGGTSDELKLFKLSDIGGGSFSRTELSDAETFTYQDVRQGLLVIEPGANFEGQSLITISPVENPQEVIVPIEEVNPTSHLAAAPVLWLDSQSLELQPSDPVVNWGGSNESPQAFQPTGPSQPVFAATPVRDFVSFDGDQFMYLNPGTTDFSQFTLFTSFQAAGLSAADATLFHLGEFELALGGTDFGPRTQSLMLKRSGDTVFGPGLPLDKMVQATALGSPSQTQLRIDGRQSFKSQTTQEPFPQAFPSLGARQLFSATTGARHFQGGIQEIILYDVELTYAERTRIEDYQLSRWNDVVVWDHRSSVLPLSLEGTPDRRNVLTGGWGADHLKGSELNDILRGGPGANRLEGHSGADRFQFFFNEFQEVILDFSEGEADVIDLSAIFSGKTGDPSEYLSFTPKTNIVPGQIPTVDTLLNLDHEADGIVDQKILLVGLTLEDKDLPRLVGEGRLFLGGLGYANEVQIAASTENLVETEVSRQIVLTRTGNTSAALTVDLTFTGSAGIDEDFDITRATGTGMIRSITFGAGETEKAVDLTPIQDLLDESEVIEVSFLPSNHLSARSEVALNWPLEDAPQITLTALQPYAQRAGQVPAILELKREGPLDEQIDIDLNFGGEALNGREYQAISPRLILPAGVASRQIDIAPLLTSPIMDRPIDAIFSVSEDKTRYFIDENANSTVTILDAYDGKLLTYPEYVETHYPGQDPQVVAGLDTDGDTIITILEYLGGSNPTISDRRAGSTYQVHNENNQIEIHVETDAGISDLLLALEVSENLVNYKRAEDGFDLRFERLSNSRVRRIYTSRLTLDSLPKYQFYRLNVSELR